MGLALNRTRSGAPPLRRQTAGGVLLIVLILGLGLSGCRRQAAQEPPLRPAAREATTKRPLVSDDGDQESLSRSVRASIRYWQGKEGGTARSLRACGQTYGPGDFLASLQEFQGLLDRVPFAEFPAAVGERFDLCQVTNGEGEGDILVTGYYQPVVKASRVRRPPFLYPVHQVPPDLISAQLFSQGVSPTVGRLEGGRLVPYWTRAEIEKSGRLRGHELGYLADPVELFLLQVQGSGLVEFTDGTRSQLLFAGTNGRPYRSIGRLLADEGRIPLAEIDMPRIRRYLHEHRDQQQRILHFNERYVFFRLAEAGPDSGPLGSMGQALTPARSVALDQERFPVGGLYFLKTERPTEEGALPTRWQPMARFVLHQDTGAAIKGPGRLDFYWGRGTYPERAAGLMKQSGQLYLLMKKRERTQEDVL